jgi:hypothetical protein
MAGLASLKGWVALRIFSPAWSPPNGAEIERAQGLVHLEDGVDGALDHARHVADDVGHRHEVLVVDALVQVPDSTRTSSRRGTSGAPGLGRGAHPQGEQIVGGGAMGLREPDDDGHILLFAIDVEQVDAGRRDGQLERLDDGLFGDAMERGLFAVDDELELGLVGFDVPIDVHDALGLLEDLDDFAGEGVAVRLGIAVDLGDEGLEHGRAGGHLGDGDAGAVPRGDGRDARADAFGDVVALGAARVFRGEVDLEIGDVGAAAHEIVPDQAVEIEGGGGADVDLVIGDLGFGADGGGDFAGDLGGQFEGAAFGHVEDDLELALVVEGQHLHLHPADADRGHRGEEQERDGAEEANAQSRCAMSGPIIRR